MYTGCCYLDEFYSYFPRQNVRFLIVIYQPSTLYCERDVFVMCDAPANSLKDVQVGDHCMIAIQYYVENLCVQNHKLLCATLS